MRLSHFTSMLANDLYNTYGVFVDEMLSEACRHLNLHFPLEK